MSAALAAAAGKDRYAQHLSPRGLQSYLERQGSNVSLVAAAHMLLRVKSDSTEIHHDEWKVGLELAITMNASDDSSSAASPLLSASTIPALSEAAQSGSAW